jgi:hypothetical protein
MTVNILATVFWLLSIRSSMDAWGITEKSGSLVLLSPLEGTCEVPLRVTFMGRVNGVDRNH